MVVCQASVLSQFAAFYEDGHRHQEAELHYIRAMQEVDCPEDTIWQYCRKLALDIRADTSGALLKRRGEALQRCQTELRRLLRLDARNVAYYMLCGFVMTHQHLYEASKAACIPYCTPLNYPLNVVSCVCVQEAVSMFRFAYRLLPLGTASQAACPLSLGQLCFEAAELLVQWGDMAGGKELLQLVLEANRDYSDRALVSLATLKVRCWSVWSRMV